MPSGKSSGQQRLLPCTQQKQVFVLVLNNTVQNLFKEQYIRPMGLQLGLPVESCRPLGSKNLLHDGKHAYCTSSMATDLHIPGFMNQHHQGAASLVLHGLFLCCA